MKTANVLLAALLLLPAFAQAQAQAITLISNGGDARSCSFAAKMVPRMKPSRTDLAACDRALEYVHLKRSDRAATYVNRGILLAQLGEYQDALNDYNEALRIDAQLAQAWNGKGNLYYLAERYDAAIAAFERALELDLPERHVAYYNLGLVYESTGDEAAAARSYNMALELMPGWAPALDKLAAERN